MNWQEHYKSRTIPVDQAAALLFALITLQDVMNDDQQGGRAIPADYGAKPLQGCADPRLFGYEPLGQVSVFDRLRDD